MARAGARAYILGSPVNHRQLRDNRMRAPIYLHAASICIPCVKSLFLLVIAVSSIDLTIRPRISSLQEVSWRAVGCTSSPIVLCYRLGFALYSSVKVSLHHIKGCSSSRRRYRQHCLLC